MRDGAAGEIEEFDGVVERRRVRAAGFDNGEDLLQIVAPDAGGHDGLAGGHPVGVAADGVDFAVVAEVAERVGEGPSGEGVRGEALVDHGQGRDAFGVGEVLKELLDLGGEEEPFVDDGAAAERGDVEEVLVADVGGADFVFDALADDVEFAFELDFGEGGGAADEDLFDVGLGGAGDAADGVDVEGGVAPAEDFEAFFADYPFEDTLDEQAGGPFDGQEDETDAVLAGGGEGEADFGTLAREEGMGDLYKKAGAIAGFRIAAAGAAVGEIDEDLHAFRDDVVRFVAVDVDHKADATGIALVHRAIQALRRGKAANHLKFFLGGVGHELRTSTEDST
jgi:hypothetical protein